MSSENHSSINEEVHKNEIEQTNPAPNIELPINSNESRKSKDDIEEEKMNSKNSSSPTSSINFISSLTKSNSTWNKTNTVENSSKTLKNIDNDSHSHESIIDINKHYDFNEKQLLNKKVKLIRHKKKDKREITINLISLPEGEEKSAKILENNYSYLSKNFNDEIDDYSRLNSEVKSLLSEEKIHKYFKEEKEKNVFSFGEEPLKLYKEALYAQVISDRPTNTLILMQNVVKTLPVLEAPEEALNNLVKNHHPIYYSHSQVTAIKNKILKIGKDKKICSCCIEAKKKNKECECHCKDQDDENKHYNCNFCTCKFSSPQGLGGHMSRTHKSQSIKFLKKREIRNIREPLRKLLEESKMILCQNHNKNYLTLLKSRQGKEIIKKLIANHQKEYKMIRKQLASQNNIELNSKTDVINK